jgi:hypothetical protein
MRVTMRVLASDPRFANRSALRIPNETGPRSGKCEPTSQKVCRASVHVKNGVQSRSFMRATPLRTEEAAKISARPSQSG